MANIRRLVDKYPFVAMVRIVSRGIAGLPGQHRLPLRPALAQDGANDLNVYGSPHAHRLVQDTEFPGVVARPVGSFASHTDYHYQTLRCNVDLLKIIQLGITFADERGELADDCPTWQFNFKFNLQEDMYAQDSIDLLTRSGIDFRHHEEHGIEVDAVRAGTDGLVVNRGRCVHSGGIPHARLWWLVTNHNT